MWELQTGSYSKLWAAQSEPRIKGHGGSGHSLDIFIPDGIWGLICQTQLHISKVRVKSDFSAPSWQCLQCWAGMTLGLGWVCWLEDGQKEQGLCGLGWPQWLPVCCARAILGCGGNWSQSPGTPQLQPHPIPSILLTQDTGGCGRKDPKDKADLQWSCRWCLFLPAQGTQTAEKF